MLDKGLYFVPLGGAEQFGVNLNLYGCDGRLMAIDCGIGFADDRFPGIDLLLPDVSFLAENRDRLDGLIVTHAHEDHVGAVAYLYDRLECPLYATAFTSEILRRKLAEHGHKHVPITEIVPYEIFNIGPFACEPLPVAHSIPDAVSIVIRTSYGNLLHSGDWNMDPQPVVGWKTDEEDFKKLAHDNLLAYIGDSTNAGVPGFSASETEVADGLYEEMKNRKGKVVVTIFSSNIGRILSIHKAATRCGRQVGALGLSLNRMIAAARSCGYLEDLDFVSDSDLGYLPNDKMVVIATGSQGEARAAMAKLARGEHPALDLERGDTVIFSARAIPGNEKDIMHVKNNLVAGGVEVVAPYNTDHTIHVSGHPRQEEILKMWQWVKPRSVIPVHGERMQLESQARLAKSAQIGKTVIPNNGSVIRLDGAQPEIVDHIEAGLYAVDQKRLLQSDHRSITERRKLQYSGFIHATIVMNSKGVIKQEPQIDTSGLIDPDIPEERRFLRSLSDEAYDLVDDMTFEERNDDDFVKEELRIGLRRFAFHILGLKPKTTVHVIRI